MHSRLDGFICTENLTVFNVCRPIRIAAAATAAAAAAALAAAAAAAG